ncbi:MAG TPA: WcaF family extracellular polysaccharide biosynthesis acetyltransferase [Bacteroidia bacterium]|nr:WcaF family extracellular polysaccharide biosynthesis acetyltransferase [Bacteroidia bacterium]HNT79084.1 WcaF family extracellular polysaccharide biosynthesis acetyltransferase [Bacteroidia bacterium]
MGENKTNLSRYDNSWYHPGANALKRLIWYFVNACFFMFPLFPFQGFKIFLLRLFGAKIGKGLVIKPSVSIKYPWLLKVGDHCWIGENVWIDNLALVQIGNHVCLSQGAMLLTGNHNYKKSTFDLMVGAITLEDGVWIGAKSIVCPRVTCQSHSVLAVNSVAVETLEAYWVYKGNPAIKYRQRKIDE